MDSIHLKLTSFFVAKKTLDDVDPQMIFAPTFFFLSPPLCIIILINAWREAAYQRSISKMKCQSRGLHVFSYSHEGCVNISVREGERKKKDAAE